MLVKASCLGHVSKWSIDSWPFWHIQSTIFSRRKFAAFQVFRGKKLVPEMVQIWSRRPINLTQTVNVSSLMTVQSVARFFSPTGSSLSSSVYWALPFCLYHLGYSWNRILSKHAWPVKDCTHLDPQPRAREWTFCFLQYLYRNQCSWMDSWLKWYQH